MLTLLPVEQGPLSARPLRPALQLVALGPHWAPASKPAWQPRARGPRLVCSTARVALLVPALCFLLSYFPPGLHLTHQTTPTFTSWLHWDLLQEHCQSNSVRLLSHYSSARLIECLLWILPRARLARWIKLSPSCPLQLYYCNVIVHDMKFVTALMCRRTHGRYAWAHLSMQKPTQDNYRFQTWLGSPGRLPRLHYVVGMLNNHQIFLIHQLRTNRNIRALSWDTEWLFVEWERGDLRCYTANGLQT